MDRSRSLALGEGTRSLLLLWRPLGCYNGRMKTRGLKLGLLLSCLLLACNQEPEAADKGEGPGPGPFSGGYNRKSLNGATDEKGTNPGLGVGIKLASTSFREG